jgi:type I restriction enzyme, S subunit
MEKQLIPKLRFPEFKEEWNKKKLDDICTINMGQSPSSTSYNSNEIGLPLIQGNADIVNRVSKPRNWTSEPTKTCNVGDLILTVRAPVGAVSKSIHKACIGRGVCSITNKEDNDIEFIYQFLLNFETKWGAIEQGSTFTAVSGTDIKNIDLFVPKLLEQKKIAVFLIDFDKRIELLKKKKEFIILYKKSLMQNFFSQQLRFKDDKGNDFPEWEEKRLGDIGSTLNGLTGKTKDHFGVGKPYIQYMQIFKASRININEFGLVEINENENQQRVQYGDVFFTTSSETPNEIGTSSVLLDKVDEVYLNSFCFGYRPNSLDELVPEFAQFLFRSIEVRKEIVKLAQGSTRFNMSKVEFMKQKISLPCKEEQQKIASFLKAIDEQIELVGKQIDTSISFKKGLLQQMFV